MDEIMKRIALKILKKAGFEAINLRSMEMLITIFEDRLCRFLDVASQFSIHAGRSSITMLDIFGANKKILKLCKDERIEKLFMQECNAKIIECNNSTVEDIFTLIPIEKLDLEYEEREFESEWISPISSRVEKFIHIYDFMPQFPPIHTFRMTMLKGNTTKSQSSKVKSRLEQSLRSEGNMIKLIKTSGSVPSFINYLYRNKK